MSGKVTAEENKIKKAESVPEGWKRVRLGEIIQENIKSPFKVEDAGDEGQYPFFTSGEVILRISRWLIDGENLFLSSGGSFYVKYYRGRASYSGDTWALKGKGKIENKYLFYFLKYNTGHITYRYFIGSGLEHLQKDFFKSSFQISYPENLPEQRKIAEILETVDNAIEKTDVIIEKYRRIKKGLMADLLTGKIRLIPYGHSEAEGEESPLLTSPEAKKFVIGDKTFVAVPNQKWRNTPIGKIPEDWEVVKLEEVAIKDGIVRGPFGGMLKKENFVSEGYKVYEQGNAIYKTINLGNYYIDRKKYKQMLRFAVKQNDFIISCSGTIGKICMIPQNFEEGVINQALLKITINDKKFDHKFFEYYFEWDAFQNKIIDYTQGGAMQNLIGINEFKKVNFPLPPLPEQQLIADVLSQVDEVIEKEIQYKEKLERIKKGLMEDLLTGKVRVNNLIKED